MRLFKRRKKDLELFLLEVESKMILEALRLEKKRKGKALGRI